MLRLEPGIFFSYSITLPTFIYKKTPTPPFTMGGRVSTVDQAGKAPSEEIGTPLSSLSLPFLNLGYHRFGRIREEHHSQANEDHS